MKKWMRNITKIDVIELQKDAAHKKLQITKKKINIRIKGCEILENWDWI